MCDAIEAAGEECDRGELSENSRDERCPPEGISFEGHPVGFADEEWRENSEEPLQGFGDKPAEEHCKRAEVCEFHDGEGLDFVFGDGGEEECVDGACE